MNQQEWFTKQRNPKLFDILPDERVQKIHSNLFYTEILEKKFVLVTQKFIWYVCESVCSFSLLACPWSQRAGLLDGSKIENSKLSVCISL